MLYLYMQRLSPNWKFLIVQERQKNVQSPIALGYCAARGACKKYQIDPEEILPDTTFKIFFENFLRNIDI